MVRGRTAFRFVTRYELSESQASKSGDCGSTAPFRLTAGFPQVFRMLAAGRGRLSEGWSSRPTHGPGFQKRSLPWTERVNENFAEAFAQRRGGISNLAVQAGGPPFTLRSTGFGERDPGEKEEVLKACHLSAEAPFRPTKPRGGLTNRQPATGQGPPGAMTCASWFLAAGAAAQGRMRSSGRKAAAPGGR